MLVGKILTTVFCLIGLVQSRSIESPEENIGETLYKSLTEALTASQKSTWTTDDSYPTYGNPEVKMSSVKLIGQTNDNTHSFFSIPYAEPPTGDLRFQAPSPYIWNGETFDASVPNYIQCPQLESPKGTYSEDCLVLNVHVPRTIKSDQLLSGKFDQQLPVMVFIHGGAFFMGSGTGKPYDGRFLAESTNSIVVSMNYRLGLLGFFSYEDEQLSFDGNQGIKDQRLAMKWVQDNIHNFGGDAKSVTLFGESAGAQSVTFHLVSKSSEPYFKRAIIQSNPAVYKYPTLKQAKSRAQSYVSGLNCSSFSSNAECLMNIPPIDLIRSTSEFSIGLAKQGLVLDAIEPFLPLVDGKEFTRQPFEYFEYGEWQDYKEVIIGTNQDEFVLLTQMVLFGDVDEEMFKKITRMLVGTELEPYVTEQYSKLVPAITGPRFDYTDIMAQEVRDLFFTCSTRRLARFISDTTTNKQSPYLYVYEHNACPNQTNDRRVCTHTCHGCELPFEFNTMEFAGRSTDEADDIISSMFSDYWTSYVRSGIPQSDRYTSWEIYQENVANSAESWTNIRILAPQTEQDSNYNDDFCNFWDSTGIYVDMKSEGRLRDIQ